MNWREYKDSLTDLEKPLADLYLSVAERCYSPFLEVGSGWGIFARAVLDVPGATLTTIDKLANRPDFDLRTAGFEDRIDRIVGPSHAELAKLEREGRKFGLIFVDGSHLYEDCLNDLRLCWGMFVTGGVLMVDDVLHPHNWDGDYGVAKAVWEFMEEVLSDGTEVKLVKCGSGGVLIIKKP